MSSLTVLTSLSDRGTQRCFVGPAVFEHFNIPIGSWCVIHHHGNRIVCSLWLRDDLEDGFIEIRNAVTIHCQDLLLPRSGDVMSIESIQPVPKPPPCNRIIVSVVTDYKHLRKLQEAPREAVTRQLRHTLRGCAVAEGCTIALQSGFQFAGPRISHVVVEECISEEITRADASGVSGRRRAEGAVTTREDMSSSLTNLQEASSSGSDEAPSSPSSTEKVEKTLSSVEGNPALQEPIRPHLEKDTDVDLPASLSTSDDHSQSNLNSSGLNHPSTSVADQRSDLNIFLITEQTKIRIKQIVSTDSIPHRARSKTRVGGLDEAASLLRKLIEYPAEYPETLGRLGLMQSQGILLRGPPGCGKTSLMQAVASECKVCLLQINGADIFGASPGESESNMRQIFDKAKAIGKTHRCVLFIDELDALCPRRDRGGDGGTHEGRVVAELLMLMDKVRSQSKVMVVGATSRPNALDPALRRPGRFDQEVLIGMPSLSQRFCILETHCHSMQLAEDVHLGELAKLCGGFTGADLASLCQQAVFRALERETDGVEESRGCCDRLEAPIVKMADFVAALSHVTPSLHRAAGSVVKELQPVSWDAIGGLNTVKAQLRQAVEWPLNHWQSFARLGLRGPSGVLLYGPPGCCKTTLARAVATACKAGFFALSCAELYSPFLGDSEKVITEVFRKARLTAPSIVFLDELDSLIGGRGSEKGRGLSERLLACLLVEMDGIGVSADEGIPGVGDTKIQSEFNQPRVLVVAASNRVDLIDAALLRPGRFDRVIYVPPPDKQARREILAMYTKRMPQAVGLDLDQLAEATDMFTGADLEALCREAGLIALQEHGLDNTESCRLQQRHLISALDWCRPSLNDELLARYKENGST